MFRRKEKELKEKLIEAQNERDNARREARYYQDHYFYERMIRLSTCKDVDNLKEELERQKEITAKHISLYYDTIQKLKNVMEETGYGKDL